MLKTRSVIAFDPDWFETGFAVHELDNAYYKEGSMTPCDICDHQPTGVEHSHWVTGLDRIRMLIPLCHGHRY